MECDILVYVWEDWCVSSPVFYIQVSWFCLVAIGTLMIAVVGLGWQLVHVDEVGRTGNPATNLTQAKPDDSAEHIIQAKLSGQASG